MKALIAPTTDQDRLPLPYFCVAGMYHLIMEYGRVNVVPQHCGLSHAQLTPLTHIATIMVSVTQSGWSLNSKRPEGFGNSKLGSIRPSGTKISMPRTAP